MKERIRSIMNHERLSQQDFAARLGISAASLSSIFTGRTNPTNNHVMAVHRAFPQVNVSWLLFGEGDMLCPSSGSAASAPDGEALSDTSSVSLLAGPSAAPSDSLASAIPPQQGALQRDIPVTSRRQADYSVNVINVDKPTRRIKEIRVFFDDGTYESFVPSGR